MRCVQYAIPTSVKEKLFAILKTSWTSFFDVGVALLLYVAYIFNLL